MYVLLDILYTYIVQANHDRWKKTRDLFFYFLEQRAQ